MLHQNLSLEYVGGWKVNQSTPSLFPTFKIETKYAEDLVRLVQNYWHWCYYFGVAYIAIIFGLQRWMKPRQAYHLKFPLFLWNACIAGFSILGFIRTAPLLAQVLPMEHGLYSSICIKEGINSSIITWQVLFVLSKFVELVDTVFIILRKRPLVFLQWYHHLSTLIVASTAAPFMEPANSWYVTLNFGVHSLMYTYFALKTIGVPVPSAVSKMITSSQFAQMLIGLCVNALSFYYRSVGYPCARETNSIIVHGVLYGSFSILFGNLFYKNVLSSKSHAKLD